MSFKKRPSLYPEIIDSNPDAPSAPPISLSSSFKRENLYPTIDTSDLNENLFASKDNVDFYDPQGSPSAPPLASENVLIKVPGAILHLIDKSYSVELACGDLTIVRLVQDENTVAVIASVADETEWPLTKDSATVKLDSSHYFFSLRLPPQPGAKEDDADVISYGLTIASKGQESLLKNLDEILKEVSCFSVQNVSAEAKAALGGEIVNDTTPLELEGKKKEAVEENCTAYWTTLAPNVEEYSGTAAKLIAAGSGQLIRGILWCGDVTVERLMWGKEVMKERWAPGETDAEVSPETLRRIKR